MHMEILFLSYLLYSIFLVATNAEKHINIKLNDGSPITGNLLRNGKAKVGEFLGIPFAEPPIKSLRFMRPVAKKPWSTALKCTKYRPACLQKEFPLMKLNANTSEDCLYLNVWAPQVQDKRRRLPVIAFIHGGGFQMGAASMANASLLASRNDVIVILMNYRVAAFGFLTVSATKATGNMGLWDQTLSLEWIKKNIANFGGDPEKVAIFGESAGGASVGFQVLSPKAANLFHAAAAQSGTPNSPWATNSKTKADKITKTLTEAVGCNNTATAKVLECLQAVDGPTLLNVDQNPYTSYYPVIDGEFLPDEPMKLAKSGKFNKVDLMVGYTANEGWMMAGMMWPKIAEYSQNFSRSQFMTSDAMWDEAVEATYHRMHMSTKVKNAIKHEYSRWDEPVTAKVRQDSLDILLTDQMFLCPMLEFAKYTANYTSTYVYKFNGIGRVMFPFPDWMGSLHAADLEYLLGLPTALPHKYLPEEAKLADFMQESFSNFAKSG